MMRHECGLFAIHSHDEAARLAYFGLYAQQHRGQESAGIVTVDVHRVYEHKGMGLVPDVFSEDDLRQLQGKIAIGHVRYSTTGISALCNAQPCLVHFQGYAIAVAHNGNLINIQALRDELERDGSIFTTTNDTEVFLHLLARALRKNDLVEAVRDVCARVRGAYCLLVLVGSTLIAVRDPLGFHPLSLGRLNGSPVFASETCAFDLLEADYVRSLAPGELFIVDDNGEHSEYLRPVAPAVTRQCIFELVYFARPDSYVFDEQVYLCRKEMGRQLAGESTPDVDFVMPFPDSGVYPALGFAQESDLPYEHAMIRNHYVGRTFIQPTQSMRSFGVRIKINPVRAMIEGKRICIVDDSIVRGTTVMTRVQKLRELGAREVHIRISCPPVKFPCYYGIDFASRGELIAARYTLPEIIKKLNVDSLHYLTIDGLLRSVMHSDRYCLACFTGDYPLKNAETGKHRLEATCGRGWGLKSFNGWMI
ncbi:MAG: amidophosphoribosyltransferase [Candidatus Desulfovibrio kirbyi]|jgi:amidophosphoribosyltransferase|uniref:Amidophosphoribosyltransferase n=1 Tax=Candidatus Desulfovibrio kirbyi TaxID=2696086 RepID=A0A6L2R714_9BACT|nr:amidophosphoribosyltransferase [Desulfovibrio sp.]GFH63252.1 MAG: amidophosphoribosyltransferase [Candidatus Desulfovibrio kirbyi]